MTNLDRWQLFMKDIESPDIFIDWGFYHMISSALQRRVWLYADPLDLLPMSFSLFPNIYTVLVGPPATGKGRVIVQEMSLIKAPGLEKPGPTGEKLSLIPCSPDKITLESLTQHIAQSVKSLTRKHPLDPSRNQAYAYCPCSFLIEELEVLFATKTNDMVSVLVHCYDSHDLHYKTKHQGEDKIKNVCVSMIAGTTPQSIKELMKNNIVKKGMTSRCIFVYADKPRFYRDFPGLSPEQLKARDELIQHLKNLTTVFGEIKMTPDAQEWQRRFYESGDMARDRLNKDNRLDDYYGRKRIHWLKLAMIMLYAEQTTSNLITLDILERSYQLLKETERRMADSFGISGRNNLYETCLDIERYLQDNGATPHKKLWWIFSRDVRKEEFEEVMGLLESSGRITNNAGLYTTKTKLINLERINGHDEQQPNSVHTSNGSEGRILGGEHVSL